MPKRWAAPYNGLTPAKLRSMRVRAFASGQKIERNDVSTNDELLGVEKPVLNLYMGVVKNCSECRVSGVDVTVTKPIDVGSLRVGGYMILDGEPCQILDIKHSKPGKHGSAKARIVAIGVFDGAKRQFVKPVDLNTEVPIIDKRTGQVFAVNPSGIQIMDLETYEYLDAPYPQDEELKAKLVPGVEIEYWKIMGRMKIVRTKKE